MISEDFSWERQIDNVVKKANRILGMLKRTFYSRDPRLRMSLYVPLVRSHFEYAVQAWDPSWQGRDTVPAATPLK